MRKSIFIVLPLLAVGLIGTYFYFQEREYVFRFTEPELQAKLADNLPYARTYLFIFEVVLDNPRLALVEGSDRVNAGLDLTLNIRIQDEPLPLGGELDVSGGVRYDGKSGQFFSHALINRELESARCPGRLYGSCELGSYESSRYVLRR